MKCAISSYMTMEARVSICLLPHLRVIDGVVVVRGISGRGSESLIRASDLSGLVRETLEDYEFGD